MTSRRVIWGVLILLPALAVAFCLYFPVPPVNDLTLVSVDVVAQRDIPARDKWWGGEIAEPLVRVTFSSSHDFQKLANRWGYYIGSQTAYCSGGTLDTQNRIQGFPYLYYGSGRIDAYARSPHASSADKRDRILYHVYFDAEQHGNVNWRPYDLTRNPRDICIQINGRQEMAGEIPTVGFRSNVLIVPEAKLMAALVKARMQLR